jgi:hypothetical protein
MLWLNNQLGQHPYSLYIDAIVKNNIGSRGKVIIVNAVQLKNSDFDNTPQHMPAITTCRSVAGKSPS